MTEQKLDLQPAQPRIHVLVLEEETGVSKQYRDVKKGDVIKVDGKKVEVKSVRTDPDGRINIQYEGKGGGGQESHRPGGRTG